MKLLFYGSPAIAVPFLELCAKEHDVALVVTQPDKPAGRKLELTPPPVKTAAQRLGLVVAQPEKPKLILEQLQAVKADLAVVVAYGRILPESVIAAARLGTMNVHFSLLPKYRGAAPMQWALLNGETRSGVSLFWLDKGMDTGPLYLMKECAVAPEDDAVSLGDKLVALGLEGLRETLASVAAGDLHKTPQEGEPSLAPMIEKNLGELDFSRPAVELHNKVRALCVWPVAYRMIHRDGKPLRLAVLRTLPPDPNDASTGVPGTLLSVDKARGVLIQCSSGRIWLQKVQPEGRKPMDAFDFANGFRLKAGDVL